jgi:hypothetical protein
MGRMNSQLFDRGDTWYGPDRTIDSSSLEGATILGQEKAFEDIDYTQSGVKGARTNQLVHVRAVRNNSGATLYGKEFVQLDAKGENITGRVVNDSQHGYPIDEYIPAAGVRNGDICYVVVEGPATMRTAYTGAEFNGDIAVGARLHSVTTTAGSTQAGKTSEGGRVANFTTVAATTTTQFNALIAYTANWVAVALSAKTTGNTNADILVDVRRRF